MNLLNILEYPDPRLKRKAKKVTDFGAAFQSIVDHMFATHYAAENCAALAATQLDLVDPPHVTVIDFSRKHDEPLCLVNGEVVEREGEQNEEEGCMSVGCNIGIPVHAHVKRAYKIRVKAQDRFGAPLDFWVEEYMAKCIQHELDHLEGKIYLDHLSAVKRERLEKKLAKEKKQKARDDEF
jgi:peptide deformylase